MDMFQSFQLKLILFFLVDNREVLLRHLTFEKGLELLTLKGILHQCRRQFFLARFSSKLLHPEGGCENQRYILGL